MQENSREVPVIGTQTQEELHEKPSLVEEQAGRPDNKSESSRRHSSKPVGRERRLQPPVFKERIERFVSKLKIREVKDELGTIDEDTKARLRYLERERIQALIDKNSADVFVEELKMPVSTNFSTEIIGNSDGQQEIRLQREDGETRALNSLLPEGYRFQEGNTFEVNIKTRTITYMPEVMQSKGGVLGILHEIGHARNHESRKIENTFFDTLSFNEKLRAGKDIAIMHAKLYNNKVNRYLFKRSAWKIFSPQWLLDKKQSWQAKDERAANAYALQEGRALEKEGFHIFAGFKDTQDIREFFNMQLMTYEGGKIATNFLNEKDLSDIYSSKFVKQHVLDKKLEEATSSIRP